MNTCVWEEYSASEVADNIGATIEKVIEERDAKIAQLEANIQFLEARLEIERASKVKA